MPRFRTEIQVSKPTFQINYSDKICFVGSCFAEAIGEKFKESRFITNINPFGILYNPVSIARSLEMLMEQTIFNEKDLHFKSGLWHSFSHHGKFSSPDKDLALAQINKSINDGTIFLKNANFLFITLGTSFVYEHKNLEMVVSNCHKYPSDTFNRYRLEVDEIVDQYKNLIVKLLVFNPKLRIIFTVSPVRHWKDGAHGNQVSKAVLLLAIDQLEQLFENVSYFPSYELVLDDLRDYRFFAEDLLHTNNLATDYIWEKIQSWFNDQTKQFCKDTDQLIKARNHRPLFPDSPEYSTFLESMLEKVNLLIERYPNANFINDRDLFTDRISELTNY
ncbi:MAG: GSCFA domain-containing protein [Marinilabiliaceae bacterium]|nr:GSCFA domain-containing protein [Marinilabiliaceae bacterium]